MSITDELRKWGYGFCGDTHDVVTAIADRIDAAHEHEMEERADRYSELRAKMNSCYIELPKDADGVPIHIWDVLDPPADCDDYMPLQVVRLTYDGYEKEWFFDGAAGGFTGMVGRYMDVAGWTHHHAPETVEDVLREFALAVCKDDALTIREGVVEEFAKRLTLAEGEDA